MKRRIQRPAFRERWRRRIEGIAINWRFFALRPRRTVKRFFRGFRVMKSVWMGEVAIAESTLRAVKISKDGTMVDYGVVSRRLVTRAFVKRLAAQMEVDFSGADEWKWHASGTNGGATAEATSNTALDTESGSRVAGNQDDTSTGNTGNYQSIAVVSYTSTLAITEHGLFNASTSGTLLDRHVFSAINVISGDSIQFTYDLTIKAEGE